MKHIFALAIFSLFIVDAFAAQNARPAMSNKIMSAPRYTASVNQLNGIGVANGTIKVEEKTKDEELTTVEEKIDMRTAERDACINNNIGIGNTFVWASRYSDTSNYANMVEDTKNPENNVCFVRVELKSDNESRVAVSDVPAKYFTWGEAIECGSWVNEKEMEKRILNAKKGARIGGIVASTVGGAGLGVGAMELFGNKLIGGKVQGQKNLEGQELYRSVLLTYKEKGDSRYNQIVGALKTMRDACNAGGKSGQDCEDYESLLSSIGE